MITAACVQKDTHTKKIDRPNRIGKLVPGMSNRIKFVNCVGCNHQNVISIRKPSPDFFRIIDVQKVQAKKYHLLFCGALCFEGK